MHGYLRETFKAYGLKDYIIEIVRPTEFSSSTVTHVRDLLRKNELSARDIVLVTSIRGCLQVAGTVHTSHL